MRCKEVQKSIMAYLSGRLHHEKAQAFKAHLETCPLCREIYAEEVEMAAAFSAEPAGLAGEHFVSAVMEKIGTGEAAAAPARTFRLPAKPWLITGACAAALAAVAIGFLGTGLEDLLESTGLRDYLVRAGDGAKGALASFGESFQGLFNSGLALYKDSSAKVEPSLGSLIPVIGIVTAAALVLCAGLIRTFRKRISEELLRT